MTTHYDCGDGVPPLPSAKPTNLSTSRLGDQAALRPATRRRSAGLRPLPPHSGNSARNRRSRVRGVSVSFAVIGQLVVGAMIAASGDLILGAVASLAVFSCCLALIASEAISSGEGEATAISRDYTTNNEDDTDELEVADSIA